MKPYEAIRLTGQHLASGESARGVCPFCRGGRSGEQSFIVTRVGSDLKYHCFRASCNHRSSGVLLLSGNPTTLPARVEKQKPHELRCPTFALTQEAESTLRDKFQFTSPIMEHYGIVQTREGDIIIPIYNSRGLIQGHERRPKLRYGPKAIRYNGADADGMGWYNSKPDYTVPIDFLPQEYRNRAFLSKTLLLVEDLYSAMKANAFLHTAAMLGASLSPEQAATIATMGYERVLLALDQDATAKSALFAKRYRALLPQLRVIVLRRDVKAMSYAEIAEMIYSQEEL